MDDFDLDRFLQAQDRVMQDVRQELGAGRKRSHWMWFVFPQLAGLGRSGMAQHYAIGSLAEAEAYLRHPVLGPRLIECTDLALQVKGSLIAEIFSPPDDVKFHSSMTLFSRVPNAAPSFAAALRLFFEGKPDQATLKLLTKPVAQSDHALK